MLPTPVADIVVRPVGTSDGYTPRPRVSPHIVLAGSNPKGFQEELSYTDVQSAHCLMRATQARGRPSVLATSIRGPQGAVRRSRLRERAFGRILRQAASIHARVSSVTAAERTSGVANM